MAPMNTVTTAETMNQHVRNQMSIMAWGMTALCAWVLFIATTYSNHLKATDNTPYTVSVPITTNK